MMTYALSRCGIWPAASVTSACKATVGVVKSVAISLQDGEEHCQRQQQGHHHQPATAATPPCKATPRTQGSFSSALTEGKLSAAMLMTPLRWDLASGSCDTTAKCAVSSLNIVFSHDSKKFVCGNMDNTVQPWIMASGKCEFLSYPAPAPRARSFSAAATTTQSKCGMSM